MSYSLGHNTAPAYCALCDHPCQTGPLCGDCLDDACDGEDTEIARRDHARSDDR